MTEPTTADIVARTKERLEQRRWGRDTIDQRGVAFFQGYGFASLCYGSRSELLFQFSDNVPPIEIAIGTGVRCEFSDATFVGHVDLFDWPMFRITVKGA